MIFDWDDTAVHIEYQKYLENVISILETFGIINPEEKAKQFLDNVHDEKLRTFCLKRAFGNTTTTPKIFLAL